MEVHQHTHTPRKKWTHYFWEFLMLFLAVFCGFLAEYSWNTNRASTGKKIYPFSPGRPENRYFKNSVLYPVDKKLRVKSTDSPYSLIW